MWKTFWNRNLKMWMSLEQNMNWKNDIYSFVSQHIKNGFTLNIILWIDHFCLKDCIRHYRRYVVMRRLPWNPAHFPPLIICRDYFLPGRLEQSRRTNLSCSAGSSLLSGAECELRDDAVSRFLTLLRIATIYVLKWCHKKEKEEVNRRRYQLQTSDAPFYPGDARYHECDHRSF